MVHNEGDKLIKVVVSPPSEEYYKWTDLQSHNITLPAEKQRAMKQHEQLCQVLADFGAEVIEIPELNGHPNSVFTRDTAVVTPAGFIKVRMGLPARRGEESWMSELLQKMGIAKAYSIGKPGTAEGGDVILAGKTVFIGNSSRTNQEGVKQLVFFFKSLGLEPRVAEVPQPYLHIGGAMSIISPDTVLCCASVFPDNFFQGFRKIEIPASGFISGNVICLGNNAIIAHAENNTALEILQNNKVQTHIVDLSEFVKGTGGPSCLVMPIERER